jgi:hypothetical protein
MAGLNAAVVPTGWDVKEAAWLAGLSVLTQIAPSSNEIADRLHRLLREPKARWNGSLIVLSGGACGAAFALILSTMLVKSAAEFLYFNF